MKVDDGAVTVHPDLDLLRGKDTVYPVYIDPRSAWASRAYEAVLRR
ncbi:hypothetical protein ACFQ3Z_44680 [Streptomyces nogalater]